MDEIAGRRFLTNRVMTATPAQRVVMLYDRAVLDIARARAEFAAGDTVAGSEHAMHALAVVSELRCVLDTSRWDGAAQLAGLYDWILSGLISARTGNCDTRLVHISDILTSLRAAWAEAAEKVNGLAPMALGSAV